MFVRARIVFVCERAMCLCVCSCCVVCVLVLAVFSPCGSGGACVCVCAVSAVCARGSVACALESAVCAVCVTCVVCSWRCVGGACAIDARAGRWCW